MNNQSLRFLILMAWAGILSSLTMVLGAIPLRYVRKAYGRPGFWLGSAVVALIFWALDYFTLTVAFAALAVLIGLYREAEELGCSILKSAFVSVLGAMGSLSLILGAWIHFAQVNPLQVYSQWMTAAIEKMNQIRPSLQLDAESLLVQVPSAVVVIMLIAVALSLIFDRAKAGLATPTATEIATRIRLRSFRLPDFFVWLLLLSLLGAFYRHDIEVVNAISWNFLNILVLLYFFQGLAVASHLFTVVRMGYLWQILLYILLVTQLFLFVAFAGFVDYWMDFRLRLNKKMAKMDKIGDKK